MSIGFHILRRLTAAVQLLLALSGLLAIALVLFFFVTLRDLPRIPQPLSRIIETPPTEFFAADGQRILSLGGREYVPLSRVSHDFIQAILATEDHRFWEHRGVDKLRTLKALWITLFQPGKVQGASTITQQLAKNLFFSFKQTFSRKFRELLVALQIESQFSKQEILEAYLNQITFGVGAVGIEAAARTFFGKPASELTLAESAFLAGLPKSPTRYNPYFHFERAKQRQLIVLQRMQAVSAISAQETQAAAGQELKIVPRAAGRRTGNYFIDAVLDDLEKRYGPEVVYHGGLKITTTLDPQLQGWAEAAVQKGLTDVEAMMGISPQSPQQDEHGNSLRPQAALVAVEAYSGAVKALVGGRDYVETEYNRAISNHRQPGSGFKPFLYYAAFEKRGLSPASIFTDKPVKIPVAGAADWQPKNFEHDHTGPMVLKRAFMDSINSVAAQLVAQTGPQAVIDVARRCGIQSDLAPVYSVALGTSGVSPLEMASAFATFATGGVRQEPFLIWRVEDAFGRVLEEHIVDSQRVLAPQIVYQVLDMMRGVVDQGTGKVIRTLGFEPEAAGKTGTTNGYRDAWFTGFTPTLSASVWVGFDKGRGLIDQNNRGITGGRAAAPIWAEFMKKATAGDPPRTFPLPPGIRMENVQPDTGRPAYFFTSDRLSVALRQGQTIGSP
jgi:1A family penicillin-binding protein